MAKRERFKDGKKKRLYQRKGLWIFLAICVLAGLGGLWWADQKLEPFRERSLTYDLERIDDVEEPSLIFDRKGKELGRIFVENRSLVGIEEVPEIFIQALLAQEDQRFFDHEGVDWIGVMRAVYLNLKAREVTQGASTITMQLARNAFDLQSEARERGEGGMDRKMVEAFLALRIEKWMMSQFPGEEGMEAKMKILEFYLNRIPFGSGFYGIRSASLGYYGKEPKDLTVEECASIVACVKNPTALSPLRSPEDNKKARDHVLNRMLEEGTVTDSEWARLRALPVKVNPKPLRRGTSHLYEKVAGIARDRVGLEAMSRGGFKIYTTIDSEVQERAQESLTSHLARIESTGGYGHPLHGDYNKASGKPPAYLQGGVLMVDSATGAVLAHVGGRDFVHSQFDIVESGRRPLGTAFLPVIYTAALENDWHPSTAVRDEPMDNRAVMIGGREGILGEWGMEIAQPRYEGRITCRRALAASKIAASVRLGKDLG
ncbi:MAG: penicillin-binding protein, partial [Akkermansiaceae bacterium]|nr:penicillin-binding protein [Akkermansiaceae bacterium]